MIHQHRRQMDRQTDNMRLQDHALDYSASRGKKCGNWKKRKIDVGMEAVQEEETKHKEGYFPNKGKETVGMCKRLNDLTIKMKFFK